MHYGKGLISVFKESFATIDNFLFLVGGGGGWALDYNSVRLYSELS